MSHFFVENCPLCGTSCGYSWVESKTQKFFDCARCTNFLVANKAEERVRSAGQVWREVWASQARSAPMHRRLSLDLPDGGSRPDEFMLGISALYIDRAKVVAGAEDQRYFASDHQEESARVEVLHGATAGDA